MSSQTQTLCSCCSCLEVWSHPMACFPPLPLSGSRELYFLVMGFCHFPGPVISHHQGRLSKPISLQVLCSCPFLTSFSPFRLLKTHSTHQGHCHPRALQLQCLRWTGWVEDDHQGLLLFLERHRLQKEMDLVLYQWAGL